MLVESVYNQQSAIIIIVNVSEMLTISLATHVAKVLQNISLWSLDYYVFYGEINVRIHIWTTIIAENWKWYQFLPFVRTHSPQSASGPSGSQQLYGCHPSIRRKQFQNLSSINQSRHSVYEWQPRPDLPEPNSITCWNSLWLWSGPISTTPSIMNTFEFEIVSRPDREWNQHSASHPCYERGRWRRRGVAKGRTQVCN